LLLLAPRIPVIKLIANVRNNPLVGRTLANFRIERLIGRGGMAEVYYGVDIKLQRPVAIKVFDAETSAQQSQANRFLQEARMMAQWRHNNIIQIYYAGDATGLFYYVMEFVDGYDLASIMLVYAEKKELMPFPDVLRIGEAVANALDYAHAKGVIHRDVKPANILIANDGRVVLGDFGLALDLRDKSRGEVFGSPHYISPEQARRSSGAVPQSDLYSLGVILYEMLTGATPFDDPSPATLALQHITETPPPPRTVNAALSEEVEQVLIKALEKDPKDRYQSGQELMAALAAALLPKAATAPANAPPLPPIPVGAPTVQRSDISLNSFTKRQDVLTALEQKTSTQQRVLNGELPLVPSKSSRTNFFAIAGAALLVALLFFGWKSGGLNEIFAESTMVPTATATQVTAVLNSTKPPQPTGTQIVKAPTTTDTVAPSETASLTPSPIPTSTITLSPTLTVAVQTTPTIKYPNGYLMTVYWSENSFYIFDQGKAARSAAGFSFERINADGSFQNHFGGWEWEKWFAAIQPNHCFSLELYPTNVSYLGPSNCDKRVLSNLRFPPQSAKIFWTPTDTSHEFRILWLDEEVARCEISAGTCDFYVP
jgi:serine/threonine protein kinase